MTEISSTSQARPFLSYRDLGLLFYLGIPTLFAVTFGWQGFGSFADYVSRPVNMFYWFGASIVVWMSLELSTQGVAWAAPKGKTPLILILLAGGLIQPLIGRPLLSLWQSLFLGVVPYDSAQPVIGYVIRSLPEYGSILFSNMAILCVWIAFNFLFDRFLGYPRFRATTGFNPDVHVWRSAAERLANLVPSGFLLRLPPSLGKEVIALSAEDHYVRVYTKLGNDLILYRFSDAVREMPENLGIQVHRSHWVNLGAITKFEESGRAYKLTVEDSVTIPVSQRYIEVLKGHGVTPVNTSIV